MIMDKQLSAKDELWIVFKYGVVGVLNTAVFTGSVYIFSKTGLGYMYYTAAGYIVAITFSFVMNMKFTFSRFPGKLLPRAAKFLITAVSLMTAAELIQYGLIEYAGLTEIIGIITGMICYTGAGFLINRLWVFR